MKYLFYILSIFSFLFVSCGNEGEDDAFVGEQSFVQLNLSIPSDGGVSTRAWGDPGAGGMVEKVPRYLYIFVMIDLGNGKFKVEPYPDNGACEPNSWTLEKSESGVRWKYKPITLSMNIVKPGSQSKVYVITSYDELPEVAEAIVKNKGDLDDLQLTSDPSKVDVYNIYANAAQDPNNGNIVKSGDSMYADVLCSHILARIDIQWNIAPAHQKQFAMRQITVSGLPSKVYFFQPTTSIPGETNDGEITFREFSVGNQWYGRWVCYAFDRNEVSCTYVLDKPETPAYESEVPASGIVKGPNRYEANKATQGQKNDAYASWYRINVKFGYPAP